MKKEYTIDSFKANTYAYKPVFASGYADSRTGEYDINASSILTRLIQEAGRYCENYASDLFIDWQTVERVISVSGEINRVFLFGFRQNGVDGACYVLSRYNGECYDADKEYRSMWRLDISADGESLEMTLGRVF